MQLSYPVTASQRQRISDYFQQMNFGDWVHFKVLHNYQKIRRYPKDILIQYILRRIGGKCTIAVVSLFELLCKNDTWHELPNFYWNSFVPFYARFFFAPKQACCFVRCSTSSSHFGSPQCKYLQLFQHYILLPMCSHTSVLISLCRVFICLHQSLLGQVRQYVYVKHIKEYCIFVTHWRYYC